MGFPVLSVGKDEAKQICLPGSHLPWCLSESCGLLRQPSSSGLQWLPAFLGTVFSSLIIVLPQEAELQCFDP